MTNQEKIAWLKRYNRFDRLIKNKIDRCEDLRSRLGKVSATLSAQPPGGGSIFKSRDHDIINTLTDLVAEMERECNAMVDARVEIATAINDLEDDREKELMEYRYLCGQTFEQIAANMIYSWQWTHELHKRALANLKIT